MPGTLEHEQPCKNGCGKSIGFHPKWRDGRAPIEVQQDGKWKLHDCPKKPRVDYAEVLRKLEERLDRLEKIAG